MLVVHTWWRDNAYGLYLKRGGDLIVENLYLINTYICLFIASKFDTK